ncbi:MAG TPA: nuclear transport factor 2 family protein [Chloroflexota bacterium]|jgi:hypothetical protein
MHGFNAHWRSRLALPVVALGMLGAAAAPAATPTAAQGWGPWGPPPGWDTEFPLPGPLGPLPGAGSMPGPGPLLGPLETPGASPMLSASESRALGTYLRQLYSISRGNGADAMSLFADDATYWFSDGVGNCSTAPCVGRDAIRAEVERQIGQHARFTPFGGDVDGPSVTGLWDIRSDRVTAAGSDRVLGTITAEVRGDRVASLRITLVRDDPPTQRFVSWLQGQGSTTAGPAAAPTAAPSAPFAGPTAVPVTMPPSAP